MDDPNAVLDSESSVVSATDEPTNHQPYRSGILADVNYVNPVLAPRWLVTMNEVPEVTQYKETSYELLQLEPGMTVLDLGCGVGDDARKLFDRVQPGGSVIGVDTNKDMIAQARSRHLPGLVQANAPSSASMPGWRSSSSDVPLSERLRFISGPAEGIPLPDRSCDAARADRLLQHISDPLIALKEMRRVLRPAGRIVLIEPDWRTMAIHPGSVNGGDDDHVLEAVWKWQIANTRHPLMGRQLRARLTQAGFDQVTVIPVAYSSTDFDLVSYILELAAASEAASKENPPLVSPQELQSWFAAARMAEADQEFFAALTLYFGFARKPSEHSKSSQ